MEAKNFRYLVWQISMMESWEEFDELCGEIEVSFQRDKISWVDHETLYALAVKVYEGVKKC